MIFANLLDFCCFSQSHTVSCPDKFHGAFKHSHAGKAEGVTLFEIGVRVKDDQVYYDLSCVDGFNVPMKVQAPDGYVCFFLFDSTIT